MAKDYKIFISHAWDYDDDLTNLQELLEQRGYFNVEFKEVTKDNPIDSDDSAYIKKQLKKKISESDIVIGLAGIYASHSEWMEWELETAIKENIPIIGVIPWGQERVSSVVRDRSIEDVSWNTESIVAAIRCWAK